MPDPLSPFQAPPPPPLVDASGRPLRTARDTLTREIAGPSLAGIRSIQSGHPAQGLTPTRLAQILRAAETGSAIAYLELAEEMEEKDLHYLSVLGTRKRQVSQLPVNVEAASEAPEDEADAQLIRDWLKRLTLQAELFDILDAVGKGYSVTEIVWKMTANTWLPDRLKWRDPRFFEFDQVTGEELLLRSDDGVPTPLHPYKYITHIAPAKSGLPIRGGLARAAAWGYLFKNYTIKDWMAFLEVYGLPLRVGKYQPGTTEEDIRRLEQAISQIGSDAGAVVPSTMMIDFITNGGTASAEMFERKAKYIDEQLSKAVLGQTSSSDAQSSGIGSGQADLHGEVRHDIETADATLLSATLTRDLGIPMVMFNRGQRMNYPLILVGRPDPVDVKQALESMSKGVDLGVPIAVSTFRKLTGLDEPKDGEELLIKAPSNLPEAGAGDAQGPERAKSPPSDLLAPLKTPVGANKDRQEKPVAAAADPAPYSPDGIELAADEALGDWERLMGGITGPIEQLVAGASSLADVKAGLIGALAAMDDSAFTETLARAGFGARLQGDVDARPGEGA